MSNKIDEKSYYTLRGVIGRLKMADAGMSMRIRLFVFLIALVMTMLAALVTILLLTGPLTADRSRAERFIGEELSVICRSFAERCGDTSVQLVSMSESLSASIENRLLDRDIRIRDLQDHPEVFEEIVGNELSRLQLALEKAKCSGVFMILDATVNPSLENAKHSRAGISIRNTEPELRAPTCQGAMSGAFPVSRIKTACRWPPTGIWSST